MMQITLTNKTDFQANCLSVLPFKHEINDIYTRALKMKNDGASNFSPSCFVCDMYAASY